MQVRVFATLRDIVGAKTIDIPLDGPCTIGDLLHRIADAQPALGAKLYNEEGAWRGWVTVLVNGRSLQYIGGLNSPVTEADQIGLFPPVGGG